MYEKDLELYSKLMNISYNINSEDIKNKFGQSERFNAINSVFNQFDATDGKKDGKIDYNIFEDFKNHNYILKEFVSQEKNPDFDGTIRTSEYTLFFDDKKIQEYINKHPLLKNTNPEDIRTLLLGLTEIDQQKSDNEYNTEAKIQKFKDIPESVIQQIAYNNEVKPIVVDGKQYYDIQANGKNETSKRLDVNGNLAALETRFVPNSDNILGAGSQILVFDESDQIAEINKYDSGLIIKDDYKSNTRTKSLDNVKLTYEQGNNKKIKNIIINDLSGEINLKCEYDGNGKIVGIKQNENNNPFKTKQELANTQKAQLDASEEENLKTILNSGLDFGNDFTLGISDNKIKVMPIIINKSEGTIPEIPDVLIRDSMIPMKKGLKNGQDYKITYTNEGQYKLEYTSNKARKFDMDMGKITYSSDGLEKTAIITKEDELKIVTNKNGQTSTLIKKRSDAFLEKLLTGDLKSANDYLSDIDYQTGDFDFFAVCKKYQDLTSKNLMTETLKQFDENKVDLSFIQKLTPTWEWKNREWTNEQVQAEYDKNIKLFDKINNFKVEESPIGNDLHQASKEIISDNKYIQIIENNKYLITKNDSSINVEKNGKIFNIDLSEVDKELKNTIYNSNAENLYRIASYGIKIKPEEGKGNGHYDPKSNTLYLNPESMTMKKLQRTLSHETGHSYYTKESPKNDTLENSFKEEMNNFLKSDDVKNSNFTYIPNNTVQNLSGENYMYCANNIYEMVAESNVLLTTGHAKSEYTIAKYFPKTFEIIKKMIEEQNK